MADNPQNQQAPAPQQVTEEVPSLLSEILEQTNISPSDTEAYSVATRGMKAFMKELLKPTRAGEKVDKRVIDEMISMIDHNLSMQVDAVLHDQTFQQLESAWR
jgi:type VI secretion system protein ImpC